MFLKKNANVVSAMVWTDGIQTAFTQVDALIMHRDELAPRQFFQRKSTINLVPWSDVAPEPSDPRRQIILTDIGRIAAALRDSRWDDLSARTVPFAVSDLLSVIQSFDGQPIYGWDFINVHDRAFDQWKNHLSLDIVPPNGSLENRIMLFQEGATVNRHLDLWIWFDAMLVRDASGNTIELSDFIAGGKRWWDALHAGDPRVEGHGIIPGGKDS